jgi:TonB family protein
MTRKTGILVGPVALLVVAAGVLWFIRRDPAQREALRGLAVLRELVTKNNYRNYGLRSFDEVPKLQLGPGVDVFFVFKGDLITFGNEGELTKVVKPSQSRLYPVEVDGEGRLLMTLRRQQGTWKVASYGEGDVARNLMSLEKNRAWLNLPKEDLIAIQIPGRHLSFASFGKPSEQNDLILTPLNGAEVMVQGFGPLGPRHNDFFNKNSNFTAAYHGTLSAKEVLSTLAETATTDDDAVGPGTKDAVEAAVPASQPKEGPAPVATKSARLGGRTKSDTGPRLATPGAQPAAPLSSGTHAVTVEETRNCNVTTDLHWATGKLPPDLMQKINGLLKQVCERAAPKLNVSEPSVTREVGFEIEEDGSVGENSILIKQGSGTDQFDEAVKKAIKDARFPPLDSGDKSGITVSAVFEMSYSRTKHQ